MSQGRPACQLRSQTSLALDPSSRSLVHDDHTPTSQDPGGDSVTYYIPSAQKTRAGQWAFSFPMRNQRLMEADSLGQGHLPGSGRGRI